MSKSIIISEIVEGKIYLGSVAATNKETLEKHKITSVVSCTEWPIKKYEGVEYHQYIIYDESDFKIEEFFAKSNKLIDSKLKEGKTILVHCMAGRSRSPSILCAYMMKSGICGTKTCEDSLKFLKSKRRMVNPNKGFREALEQYEREMFSE